MVRMRLRLSREVMRLIEREMRRTGGTVDQVIQGLVDQLERVDPSSRWLTPPISDGEARELWGDNWEGEVISDLAIRFLRVN